MACHYIFKSLYKMHGQAFHTNRRRGGCSAGVGGVAFALRALAPLRAGSRALLDAPPADPEIFLNDQMKIAQRFLDGFPPKLVQSTRLYLLFPNIQFWSESDN